MIQESLLITKREAEVINKRLLNKKLSQQDSNYLSRYVRPKLREIMHIDGKLLLQRLEYNQKIPAIERYIKNLILKNIKYVSSITLYGSVVYNNYRSYNDIDLLVTVKKKFWKNMHEKYSKMRELKGVAKKHDLKLDIEIYPEESVYHGYSSLPSLIYQLKDRKTIYGKLKLPSKIEIPKIELRMKLDYSRIDDIKDISGSELYKAIRNMWLVRLILDKIVDNARLKHVVFDEVGKNLIERLKMNKCSPEDKEIALIYLKSYLRDTEDIIKRSKWEKIVL